VSFELWFVVPANVFEPPHAVSMGRTSDEVVVAIHVQVFYVDVGNSFRIHAVFCQGVRMECPLIRCRILRLFPPAVSDQDIITTVVVQVSVSEAMVILERSVGMRLTWITDRVKLPLLCDDIVIWYLEKSHFTLSRRAFCDVEC